MNNRLLLIIRRILEAEASTELPEEEGRGFLRLGWWHLCRRNYGNDGTTGDGGTVFLVVEGTFLEEVDKVGEEGVEFRKAKVEVVKGWDEALDGRQMEEVPEVGDDVVFGVADGVGNLL